MDASRTIGLATRSSQDHWLRNAELRLQLARDAPGKAMDLGDTLLKRTLIESAKPMNIMRHCAPKERATKKRW